MKGLGGSRCTVRAGGYDFSLEAAMEQNQAPELEIHHEDHGDAGGSFYVEVDGRRLGELRYTRSSAQTVVLEHTEVSPLLGGRGVGRKLVDAAVAWARRSGTKLVPVCTYAKSVFERNPGLRDVLA